MDHDVIIIGGGFAGLAAAMPLVRARRRVALIDAGLPRNRFSPASHGFLGQDGVSPAQIRARARAEIAAYPTATLLDGAALSASGGIGAFAVTLSDGRVISGARLILAGGVADRLPDIPGLAERWGVTVLHCPYCHGYELGGRPVAVLAVHPMSVHQALLLPDWGPTTFLTNGQFPPDAQTQAHLARRGVRVVDAPLAGLLGTAPGLDGVRLVDGQIIDVAALFVGAQTEPVDALAASLGCATETGPMGPYLVVDMMKATSVPGVFAAGDLAAPFGNAMLAAAAGTTAGLGAHRSLLGLG